MSHFVRDVNVEEEIVLELVDFEMQGFDVCQRTRAIICTFSSVIKSSCCNSGNRRGVSRAGVKIRVTYAIPR